MKGCHGLKRQRRDACWLGRMRVRFLGQFSPSRSSAPLGGVIAANERVGSVGSQGSLFAACQCLIILTSERARADELTHFHGSLGCWYPHPLVRVRFWITGVLCRCSCSWVSTTRIVQGRMPVAMAEGKRIGHIILLAEIYGPISLRLNWWCRLKWKLGVGSSLIWQHENLSPAGKKKSLHFFYEKKFSLVKNLD